MEYINRIRKKPKVAKLFMLYFVSRRH